MISLKIGYGCYGNNFSSFVYDTETWCFHHWTAALAILDLKLTGSAAYGAKSEMCVIIQTFLIENT